MTLQYARLYQMRACIRLLAEEGPLSQDELTAELVSRKHLDATLPDSEEGVDDVIGECRQTHLVTKTGDQVQLTTHNDIEEVDRKHHFVHSGKDVAGAVSEREEADRILANIIDRYPNLIPLARTVHERGPMESFELKQEFDGQSVFGERLNSFTIDMGLGLLTDVEVIEEISGGYVGRRWPGQLFAHVLVDEYLDMTGIGMSLADADVTEEAVSVNEGDLYERLETVYGMDRGTFESKIDAMQLRGLVSEESYDQVVLKLNEFDGTHIHE